MTKYCVQFEKTGYIRYTSHLDLQRLFKRAGKRADIGLQYTQGYHPHPKLSFAQPLSLGYTSCCEWVELATETWLDPSQLRDRLQAALPPGITLRDCRIQTEGRSLAAAVTAATYVIRLPKPSDPDRDAALLCGYLDQPEILAEKRQKKTGKTVTVDIRPGIRSLSLAEAAQVTLVARLDCGSSSNLSPELVIATFLAYAGWEIPRYAVAVARTDLEFDNNFQI